MEGNTNFKNTNADPETSTLTHQGHPTRRLSMESSLRAINIHALSDPIQWSGVLELFQLVTNVPVYGLFRNGLVNLH